MMGSIPVEQWLSMSALSSSEHELRSISPAQSAASVAAMQSSSSPQASNEAATQSGGPPPSSPPSPLSVAALPLWYLHSNTCFGAIPLASPNASPNASSNGANDASSAPNTSICSGMLEALRIASA